MAGVLVILTMVAGFIAGAEHNSPGVTRAATEALAAVSYATAADLLRTRCSAELVDLNRLLRPRNAV